MPQMVRSMSAIGPSVSDNQHMLMPKGLFESFIRALDYVGIVGWEKMTGFGCDGTSVNIGAGGLRCFLEKSVPWVVIFWCLELSLKDVCKATFFSFIDEMLSWVYYLYEKFPKKCRERDEVVAELKAWCLTKGGIGHYSMCKWDTFCFTQGSSSRKVDRYGAYTLPEPPHCSYRWLNC